MKGQNTLYGFTWGPLEVMRVRDGPRRHTISLKTKRSELEVYFTPTGLLRVYDKKKGVWYGKK